MGVSVVRREKSVELVNRIANHPSVWKVVARHGQPIDWSPALNGCIILTNGEDAAQVYERTDERDWQVVTMFCDTCRGKRALETAREMREYMLPWADLVFGSIPDNLPHAKWFYRQLGGVPVESVESGGRIYTANDNETLYAFRAHR